MNYIGFKIFEHLIRKVEANWDRRTVSKWQVSVGTDTYLTSLTQAHIIFDNGVVRKHTQIRGTKISIT